VDYRGNLPLSSEPVLKAADTIILLDMPLLLCLWRVFKRHREEHGRRRDLPEGCTDKLDQRLIWKVLTFRFQGKKTFQQMLDNRRPEQKAIWLHSPEEVEEFLEWQVSMTDSKRSSSSTSTLVGATTGS
jgi:adenylate kinase family enzyme